MLILSILYFSYLGRSPTLLFAIKKHFCWLTRFLSDGVVVMGHPLCLMVVMSPVMYWPACCGVDGSFMNIRVWKFSTWKALGFLLNFLKFSPISLKWDKFGRFERLILTIELVTMWIFFLFFLIFFVFHSLWSLFRHKFDLSTEA